MVEKRGYGDAQTLLQPFNSLTNYCLPIGKNTLQGGGQLAACLWSAEQRKGNKKTSLTAHLRAQSVHAKLLNHVVRKKIIKRRTEGHHVYVIHMPS